MAMTAAISSNSFVLALTAGKIWPARRLERIVAPPAERGGRRRWAARPAKAMEPPRNWEFAGPRGAMTEDSSEKEIGEMRYEELAREMENASPLAIVDRALEMFGNEIAIAFSGAEDVALLEYARLTGRPFRVITLDTGRLNPETYQFFDVIEKHYGIHIEFMFPDSVEVQALVRRKGLFSFYEDGHHECCMVRKVRPLRRALRGFKAWITGQRKDQLLDTASRIPIVQVDPSFKGLDEGESSLIKWNPIANIDGNDIWNFLRAMEVPVNPLHSQGFVSIGCEPCTRPVLPNQHETEGRWWWEDAKTKECGLHSANASQNNSGSHGTTINGVNDMPDIFEAQAIVSLTKLGMMNLLKLEKRKEPWLVVLYAPWCRFCQAMESSYVELAEKLNGLGVKVGKFRSDGDHKTFAKLELELGSFPTIIFFPNHASRPVKYPSKRRDVDSLLAFVNAFR